MILIATKHADITKKLSKDLAGRGSRIKVVSSSEAHFLRECYHPEVSTVIIDEESLGIPYEANLDLVNSLGRRVPVIVIRDRVPEEEAPTIPESDSFTDHVTVLNKDQYDDILATATLFFRAVDRRTEEPRFFHPLL